MQRPLSPCSRPVQGLTPECRRVKGFRLWARRTRDRVLTQCLGTNPSHRTVGIKNWELTLMPWLTATEVVQGSEATFAQHGAMSGPSNSMPSCIIAELTLADSSRF